MHNAVRMHGGVSVQCIVGMHCVVGIHCAGGMHCSLDVPCVIRMHCAAGMQHIATCMLYDLSMHCIALHGIQQFDTRACAETMRAHPTTPTTYTGCGTPAHTAAHTIHCLNSQHAATHCQHGCGSESEYLLVSGTACRLPCTVRHCHASPALLLTTMPYHACHSLSLIAAHYHTLPYAALHYHALPALHTTTDMRCHPLPHTRSLQVDRFSPKAVQALSRVILVKMMGSTCELQILVHIDLPSDLQILTDVNRRGIRILHMRYPIIHKRRPNPRQFSHTHLMA